MSTDQMHMRNKSLQYLPVMQSKVVQTCGSKYTCVDAAFSPAKSADRGAAQEESPVKQRQRKLN